MGSVADRIIADLEFLSDLPSPSPVLVKLTTTLGNEDVDLREIEQLISRDPVIAGRVIQAANAAAYAGYGETSSIHNALLRLGLIRVRRLALLLGLYNALPGQRIPDAFWPHSLAVATWSDVILRNLPAVPEGGDPDVVFLAALLHDLGLLVLATHYPAEYEELRQAVSREGRPLDEVEDAVIGLDHGAIGARLTSQWRFPPAVSAAIAGHHRVASVAPEHRWNALVVHAAEILSQGTGIDMDEGVVLAPGDTVLIELGITPGMLPTLVAEAQAEAEQIGRVLAS
jgi:putative nucleotidyltransferase with HDIG domain